MIMKAVLLAIGLTFIVLHCASAQNIADPIRDYLTTRDADRDAVMPNLTKLFVVKCDLTNSGKLSILISFDGYGGHQGNYWTAYLPTGSGYVKADDSDTTLLFHRDAFYVGRVAGKYGLLAYAPGKGGGDLNLFQIVNGKVTEQKIGSFDLSKPQDKKEIESYFGEGGDWKSLKNYSVKTLSVDELKHAGYDADAAIQGAKNANHPLNRPLGN